MAYPLFNYAVIKHFHAMCAAARAQQQEQLARVGHVARTTTYAEDILGLRFAVKIVRTTAHRSRLICYVDGTLTNKQAFLSALSASTLQHSAHVQTFKTYQAQLAMAVARM